MFFLLCWEQCDARFGNRFFSDTAKHEAVAHEARDGRHGNRDFFIMVRKVRSSRAKSATNDMGIGLFSYITKSAPCERRNGA